MNLLKIAFAIIIGLLAYWLMDWLVPKAPQAVDVLVGLAAAIIVYLN